jgi:hypothetical protein
MHHYDPNDPNQPDDGDFEYYTEESLLEYNMQLEDIASDSDDFARSDEEGWYYSDEA